MKIRRITAELLRAGDRHNQLLSKLTRYLGVCGEESAGIVSLPFNHADFIRELNELRYGVTDERLPGRRRAVLDSIGSQIASVLAQVPFLPGALNQESSQETLTHLRLVLSASELALLPFEASKVPISPEISSENCLSLSTRPAVCITRQIRSVSSEGVSWPSQPRILFVSGSDVPFDEHLQALRKAIRPWVPTRGDETEDKLQEIESDWLVVERNGTRESIAAACRSNRFTHVHVLAHGAVDETRPYEPFGVLLGDAVLSGRDLATALTDDTATPFHTPSVVTLATCDSAQQQQVYTPDGSVAHELHECGIPLVVASQFPLSIEGSIPFVETFYTDQLWGESPLLTMFRVRMSLSGRPEYHDWASLVVYEALPFDLDQQLEELQYWQRRRAHRVAQSWMEQLVDGGQEPSDDDYARLNDARSRLPNSGRFHIECIGLKAAEHKRLAELEFKLARQKVNSKQPRHENLERCHRLLVSAWSEYRLAVETFLAVTDEPVHELASLHWLAVQEVSLAIVLGYEVREEVLMTAKLSATIALNNKDRADRVWSHVSLAELSLLSLALNSNEKEHAEIAKTAEAHVKKIVQLMGRGSEQARFTARQFRRYFHWWGDPEFSHVLRDFGVPKRDWTGSHGLLETAKVLAELLAGPNVLEEGWKATPESCGIEQISDRTERRADQPVSTKSRMESSIKPAHSSAAGSSKNASSKEPKVLGKSIADSDFVIELLPARNGDCIWVQYGAPEKRSRFIIDCGAKSAAKMLEDRLATLGHRSRTFEIFILTHIDSDHISGAIPFFKKTKAQFDDIWFNGWPQLPKDHLDRKFMGVKQGEEYSKIIAEKDHPWNRRVDKSPDGNPGPIWIPSSGKLPSFELQGGMKLTLLSPRQEELEKLAKEWDKGRKELEPSQKFLGGKRPPPIGNLSTIDLKKIAGERTDADSSVANGSSIAVLAEFGGKAALFAGDAHAEVLAHSIRKLLDERKSESRKLRIDALKLSHHGSANALSNELLELLECRRYLVSTDGSHFYHPHREAIARVIVGGGDQPHFYFNYPAAENEFSAPWSDEQLQSRYGYVAHFPEIGDEGIRVVL